MIVADVNASLAQRRDEAMFMSLGREERLGECVFVLGKFRLYFLKRGSLELISDVHVFDVKQLTNETADQVCCCWLAIGRRIHV